MPATMKLTLTVVLGLVQFAASTATFAGALPAYDELNADQKAQIQAGKQVSWSEDVSKSPWPKVFVYQRVEATPEEVTALFHDYEFQSAYIPKVISCKIAGMTNPSTARLDYVLSVPAFEDEAYSVEDHVQKTAFGYQLGWSFIKASTTKHIEGNARFETLGTGTLIAYYNFIIPGRPGAGLGWIVNGAKQAVRDTVSALANKVVELRNTKPAQLQGQIAKLRAALGQ